MSHPTPTYIPAPEDTETDRVGPLPLTRKISAPPAVGPFGGSASEESDGFVPVRSREQAERRELTRELSRIRSRGSQRGGFSLGQGQGSKMVRGASGAEVPASPTTRQGQGSVLLGQPIMEDSTHPDHHGLETGEPSTSSSTSSGATAISATLNHNHPTSETSSDPHAKPFQLPAIGPFGSKADAPGQGPTTNPLSPEEAAREREADRAAERKRTGGTFAAGKVVGSHGQVKNDHHAHDHDAEKGASANGQVNGESGHHGIGAIFHHGHHHDKPPHDESHPKEKRGMLNGEFAGEEWMVGFDEGDQANPKNWTVAFRWYITALGSILVLNSTFASSAPSGIVTEMKAFFGFGSEVATLTISLFVAGYCVGPLFWGPLSESFGRKPIFLIAFLGYTGWQVGCALSPNTASILIFRLLGGIFASSPLTNAGAILADIWGPKERGIAMAIFSLAPFAGPALGPIVGGFIGTAGVSWRWLYWVLTMFAGFCGLLVLFTLPETYAPTILAKKARRIRKETGEVEWWAPIERKEQNFKAIVSDVLVKPFKILGLEPMLQALTLYMSFVYGTVYLQFEAFPIVFSEGHGFSAGITGLMFLGLFLGGAIAVVFYVLYYNRAYVKMAEALAPNPVPPEVRLHGAVVAAPLLVIAFFGFGWTSYPTIPWIAPCIFGGVLGFSVLLLFVTIFNYIVDVYLWSAASALAANTVCRSLFGAIFPLFANQMYTALNPRWASTLLGFVALAMVPIPLVLIKFGPKLRARSKFVANK